MNTFWFSYRGLSPHKFTPMPGVHKEFEIMPLRGTAQLAQFGKKEN
jgi:hypothetical protein